MTVRDLLTGMLLPSADDAAEVLAYNVGGGSVARFVAMMNARARELDLTHTHYATPVGLDTPGNYSSAGDLVSLARYDLLTEPFIRATVAEPSAVLTSGNHVRYITNRNDLVGRYWWINGVKTGHTNDAGYVLVVSGTRVKDGMTLIGAVLGASSMAGCDSAALSLLDWGFAAFQLRKPVLAGQTFARPAVSGQPGRTVRLIAASAYAHVFPRGTRVRVRVMAPAELTGPLRRHAVVGFVKVIAGRRVVARIPLLLAHQLT
jgi:serine-type D-Ala-D-Ala carboxypeptidase (penicillin-binding protein 5/6)